MTDTVTVTDIDAAVEPARPEAPWVNLTTPMNQPVYVREFLATRSVRDRVACLNAAQVRHPCVFGPDPAVTRMVVMGALSMWAVGLAAEVRQDFMPALEWTEFEMSPYLARYGKGLDPGETL